MGASAMALTTRLKNFTNVLARWERSSDPDQFLVHPLRHQYTSSGLKLELLKGEDAPRARHAQQGCQEHGGFYMLLGNMKLVKVDPNDPNYFVGVEDEEEHWERYLMLTRVVDGNGYSLLQQDRDLIISEDSFLEDPYGRDRDPDSQYTEYSGGYMGNQHAEIEYVYEDSVRCDDMPARCPR